MTPQKTILISGASQGIGAGLVNAFLDRGYAVVGTARNATRSSELKASNLLALVDGDIADPATAKNVTYTALDKFG